MLVAEVGKSLLVLSDTKSPWKSLLVPNNSVYTTTEKECAIAKIVSDGSAQPSFTVSQGSLSKGMRSLQYMPLRLALTLLPLAPQTFRFAKTEQKTLSNPFLDRVAMSARVAHHNVRK